MKQFPGNLPGKVLRGHVIFMMVCLPKKTFINHTEKAYDYDSSAD